MSIKRTPDKVAKPGKRVKREPKQEEIKETKDVAVEQEAPAVEAMEETQVSDMIALDEYLKEGAPIYGNGKIIGVALNRKAEDSRLQLTGASSGENGPRYEYLFV
jgi:hypothetical protein